MVQRILKDDPTPITDFAPDLPPRLVDVAMRAVCKDRATRHATAAQLAGDLEAVLASPAGATGRTRRRGEPASECGLTPR